MAEAIAERRDQVLAARARAAEAARRQADSAQGIAAYIDVHKDDLDQVEPLIQYLESKGVRVEYRPTMGDPKVAEERFRNYLRTNPAVILFYGKVGAQWVTSRYLLAVQQKVVENLPTRITLYVGAPEKSEQDLQFANNMPVARNSAGFDPAAVDALLKGVLG